MKKVILKQDFHETVDYKKGDILIKSQPYNYTKGDGLYIHEDIVENNPSIFEVYEEDTAEERANKLRFKIGDKVWYIKEKNYFGEIKSFKIYPNNELGVCNNDNNIGIPLKLITNKVAILCSNKEDFEYVNNLLKYNLNIYQVDFNEYTCIIVNNKDYITNKWYIEDNNYLLLTIDKYCKDMGIKPLFVTEDGKNIYNGMNVWHIEYSPYTGNHIYKATTIGCIDNLLKDKTFSTEQAAQNWLDSQILFYTEDYKDGRFPVKSCDNCTRVNEYGGLCSNYACKLCTTRINGENWQGEFKGESIKKDDKCWCVYIDKNPVIIYSNWNNDGISSTYCIHNGIKIKYFSNETNARNYYSKLIAEQRGIKIGNKVYQQGTEDYAGKVTGFGWSKELNKPLTYTDIDDKARNYSEDRGWLTDMLLTEKEVKGSDNDIDKKQIIEIEGCKDLFDYLRYIANKGADSICNYIQHQITKQDELKSIKSCTTCLFVKQKNMSICASCYGCGIPQEKQYNKWQSKQDLSNTKIWIGDNPKLSELVQKKAFELGWEWSNYKPKEIKQLNSNSLYFYEDKFICYNNANKEYFNNCSHIEITPQDLGIKEEEYKVILTTEDGVNIYMNDKIEAFIDNFNDLSIKTICITKNTKIIPEYKHFAKKENAEKYVFEQKLKELKLKYNQ